MSDTNRTELPEMDLRLYRGGFCVATKHGNTPLNKAQATEALRRINAYPADREAIRVMREALEKCLSGFTILRQAGAIAIPSGMMEEEESAKAALKLASALGVGESTLKENGE